MTGVFSRHDQLFAVTNGLFSSLSRQREEGCDTRKILGAVYSYWTALENNIFKNYFDALFGFIPLVLLPAASLLPALRISEADLWNYTFPIASISIAGIYDAYGRWEEHKSRNLKLGIRIALNCMALLLSAILVQLNCSTFVRCIPGFLLTACGLALLGEIWMRVRTSIEMSEWYRG